MIRLFLLLSVCVGLMGQISSIPGATPGGGSGAPNVTASSTVAVTSLPMNISSLNLSSLDTLIVQCWSGASAPFSPVTITSINPASTTNITINFASTANVVCRANSNGGAGPQGVPGAPGPSGANGTNGTNGTNGAISQLQDEGSNVTVRPTINFVGSGVTATDDAANNRTLVTVSGGGGGGHVIQNNGVSVTQRDSLNIISGTGVTTAFGDSSSPSRTSVIFGADTSVLLTQATAQAGTPWLCTGTGTAGAQTCNMTPALGAYTSGQVIQYRPGTTNVTTQTIAINGLTAVSILRHDGSALAAGDLTAGRQYPITYDGTAFRLPPAGGGGGLSQAVVTQLSMAGTCLSNDVMQLGADWMMPQSSSSLAPSTACQLPGGGSNNYRLPSMSFTAAGNQEAVLVRVLPTNRTGNIDLHLYVSDNFGSGVFKFDVTKACLVLGAGFDPSLSYTDTQSIQWTSTATSFAYRSLLNVTVPSGCQPGDTMYLRIKRDGAVGGNSGGTARLVSAYTVMRTN